MADYRLYFLNQDGDGRIERAEVIQNVDDSRAIELCEEARGSEPMELWSGLRQVRV